MSSSDERLDLDERLRDWAEHRTAPPTDPAQGEALVALARERSLSSPVAGRRWLALVAVAAGLLLAVGIALRPEPSAPLPAAERVPTVEAPVPQFAAELLYQEGSGSVRVEEMLSVIGEGRLLAKIGQDRVALGSDTEVQVEEARPGVTRLRLASGAVAAEVEGRSEDGEFVVLASDVRVRVTGTRFAVESRGSDLRVAVEEGSVEVRGPGQVWWVDGGSQLLLSSGGGEIEPLPTGDASVSRLLSPAAWEDPLTAPASAPAPRSEEVEVLARADSRAEQPAMPSLVEARARLLEGETDAAVALLEERVASMPGDSASWSLLASALRKAGDRSGALVAWQRAAELQPGPAGHRARYEAASLLQEASRHAEALDLLQQILASEGAPSSLEPDARLRLARSMRALGQLDAARAELEDIVLRFPGTAPATSASELLREELL